MTYSFGFFSYWCSILVLFGLIIVCFISFLQRSQALAGPNFILCFHIWCCWLWLSPFGCLSLGSIQACGVWGLLMNRDECVQKAIQLFWSVHLYKSLLLWAGKAGGRGSDAQVPAMHVGIHSFRGQVCKVCLINIPSFMEAAWVWRNLFLWSSWDLQQGPGASQLPCIGITPLKSVQTSWGFWTHKCNYCYNTSIKEVIIIFTLSFHFEMRKLFPLGSVKVIYIMHNNGLHENIIIVHLYGTIWALEASQTHVRKGPCLEEFTSWIASYSC